MKPLPLSLPPDCLLNIVRLAATPEPGAAAESGSYLRHLLAVGGVCRAWRAATLAAPFDADISWAQLRRFVAQVLATDARAAALRRLAVSGAVPLAHEVAGAVGVNSFSNYGWQHGAEAQQEVYRALWRDLGLHRIHGTLTELSLQCGKPPRGDFDVTPSILLHSLRMELLQEDTQPWPRLERLAISCPFVHVGIGSELVRCFPALRSLEWAELLATEEAWGAIAADANLRSQLTRLCLGIAFDEGAIKRHGRPIFEMPSLAALAQLQELEVAYNEMTWQEHYNLCEARFGYLDPSAGQWLPPALRHLRLAGGEVLLPSAAALQTRRHAHHRLRALQLGGLEASLQSLVLVTDVDETLFSMANRTPSNLLEELPVLPALRALGIVLPECDPLMTPGLRIVDLLSKLPALTHLFIPAHPIDEPTIGSKYRLVLEPQSKQQLPSELAALASRHIRIFVVDYNDIPEMQVGWAQAWGGCRRPSDALAVLAGGRNVTAQFNVALVGGEAVEREPAACVSRLVQHHERAVEFAREQGWAVLAAQR